MIGVRGTVLEDHCDSVDFHTLGTVGSGMYERK